MIYIIAGLVMVIAIYGLLWGLMQNWPGEWE